MQKIETFLQESSEQKNDSVCLCIVCAELVNQVHAYI